MEFIEVTLPLIHPSPTNPRKSFPADEMAEMIDSVKRKGVIQPILVRPWPSCYSAGEGQFPAYELVAGERRYRAAKGAKLESIPVILRNLSDNEVLEIQIIENLQRKGLHELEEAEGYELMIKDHGYTADGLAEKIDKSRAYVYGRLKLTALCMGARLAFREKKLNASTALLIARIPGEKLQMEALDKITAGWEGILPFRKAAEVIQREFCFNLDKAPFPQENLMLQPAAGACSTCQKRSGNSPELCPDTKRTDVCTDPHCYKAKSAAWVSYQAGEAKKDGKKVIIGEAARKIDIEYSNPSYSKLDATQYQMAIPGNDHPTTQEILDFLGDKAPESVMVENHRKGALVEAVDNDQLKKALAQAGIKTGSSQSEKDKELAAKTKAENEFRRRLFLVTHNAINAQLADEESVDLETEELNLIARQFWSCLWSEAQAACSYHWTHEGDEKEFHTKKNAMIHRVTERIPTMNRREIVLFLIDCSLIGQTSVNEWRLETSKCTDLLATATASGIDPDSVRAEIAAEKAAKKAKSTTAKTTSTPTKAPQVVEASCEKKSVIADTPWPTETNLKAGDRVRVKTEMLRKWRNSYAGKEGVVQRIDLDESDVHVSFGDQMETFLFDEIELLPPIDTPSFSQDATPKIGDRVKIKADAKGASGHLRKCCGKEGDIEAIRGQIYAVRFAPGKDGVVANLTRDEFDFAPAPITFSAPLSPLKAARAAVMYRHPKHDTLEWSGRGKQPVWVANWINDGGELEALRVQGKQPKQSSASGEANAKTSMAEVVTRCTKTLELPLA